MFDIGRRQKRGEKRAGNGQTIGVGSLREERGQSRERESRRAIREESKNRAKRKSRTAGERRGRSRKRMEGQEQQASERKEWVRDQSGERGSILPQWGRTER